MITGIIIVRQIEPLFYNKESQNVETELLQTIAELLWELRTMTSTFFFTALHLKLKISFISTPYGCVEIVQLHCLCACSENFRNCLLITGLEDRSPNLPVDMSLKLKLFLTVRQASCKLAFDRKARLFFFCSDIVFLKVFICP